MRMSMVIISSSLAINEWEIRLGWPPRRPSGLSFGTSGDWLLTDCGHCPLPIGHP